MFWVWRWLINSRNRLPTCDDIAVYDYVLRTVFIHIFCLESFAELSICKATEEIKYKSPASESRTDVSLPVIKHSSCGHVNICRVHLRVSELVRRPAVRQTRQTVVINSCSLSIRARIAGLNKGKVAYPTSLCLLTLARTFQHPQLLSPACTSHSHLCASCWAHTPCTFP